MVDLRTEYSGLELKNPVIAASSTLTDKVSSIKKLEDAGVAAVVLRSIFEEEITHAIRDEFIETAIIDFDEDLFDFYEKKIERGRHKEYLDLITEAKSSVDIPVIASVSCTSDDWVYFASKIEDAGADAIELNMFILPFKKAASCGELEKIYFEIIEKVLHMVKIPVSIKLTSYFSDLSRILQAFSKTGIKGLVLFGKLFTPDFNLETEEMEPSYKFSTPEEIVTSLRWVAMVSDKIDVSLAASTGVHDGAGLIKQLLAGADAVQIASVLYREGFEATGKMLNELSEWMERKGYEKLSDFKGKMSYARTPNRALYSRVQHMKYFGPSD